MSRPQFAPRTEYVTYIGSTPEQVWQALTSPELSRKYFFGRSVEVDCRIDGSFVLRMPDGRVDSQGRVVECDPPRRLSVTWRVEWLEEFRQLAAEVVRLTLTESHPPSLDEKYAEGGRRGWPMILSGLKTLLETGKPLPITPPQPPQ